MCLRLRLPLSLLILMLVPAATAAARSLAQDDGENRAALVIRSGDGHVNSHCVSFSEPEISGLELLQRAGRDAVISDSGLGVTVCQLDGVGCPAGNCFCQCRGEPCVYWSYWHRQGDDWQYAAVGASAYEVQPGDVQGWSWGPGSVSEAIAPPPLTFADVCEPGDTTADSEPAAVVQNVPTPAETGPAAPVSPAPDPPPVGAQDGDGWLYGIFGAIVLGLGASLWWLQRREAGS